MGDFGVAVSPFELEEWSGATGINPDFCMIFESWAQQRALTDVCNRALAFGHRTIAVTWEPWTPTTDASGETQPEWAAETILAGDHDDYIDAVARSLRDSRLNVYLRFAHEANGGWYPWSADPAGYVAAWKYVRYRMRSMRAAWNVKMVWSPNYDLWRTCPADWLTRLLPYWPGRLAVDHMGTTMIDFGAERDYTVDRFAARFDLAYQLFERRTKAMETNVNLDDAVDWLWALTEYVGRWDRPLSTIILSQGASRLGAGGGTGDMDWFVGDYPEILAALEAVIAVLHAT